MFLEVDIDAFLAVISLRVVREYSDRGISRDSVHRILEAGRSTGSGQNRQPWKFYVVLNAAVREELAGTVFAPENLRTCQLAIAIGTTSKSTFDAGRAVQNMALAAWAEGIGSCPNGFTDAGVARRLLSVPEGESIATLLSFGYPLHPRLPNPDDVGGILSRINRKPLDQLAVWIE